MKKSLACAVLLALIAVGAVIGYRVWWNAFYFTVERTDVNPSPDPLDDLKLVDDLLEDKNPEFDPQLVDRRDYEGWQINKSGAVIRLDCPDIRPDREEEMTQLYASYADATQAASKPWTNFLPSANMLDGIAKQFDDGLYAALDLACFAGNPDTLPAPGSAVVFIKGVFERLPEHSPAVPFLAAALSLAGESVELDADNQAKMQEWLAEFEADVSRSKPISFYTWSDDLTRVWKFFRFLQHPFVQSDLRVPIDMTLAMEANPESKQFYGELIEFYSQLTNPPESLNLVQLWTDGPNLKRLIEIYGVDQEEVCVFPPSTSRETELFNRMFADGSPGQMNLMVELIRRIRSGEVDLTPREGSGWYEHQVYALETLVLPERGSENQKLLLTAKYKRRLVQAFQAMITKRRETHARQLAVGDAASAAPPKKITPRLRVEPCITYYLRTARSYAFLESFLEASVEEDALNQIHGLREGGQRELDLQTELTNIKQLFYGFHLVACEDIGLAHGITDEESVDREAAYAAAERWLNNLEHPDLAVDTRVSVPILNDPMAGTTHLWATIGIRLVKLDAEYARAPMMRENEQAEWQEVERHRLGDQEYVIAVDEFAEFELPGRQALTRQELRDLCDRHKTKQAIVQALSN
ncbi:MAG: hypothetical protein ACR2NP_14565 [Pirellulaceae bacterium]